MSVLPSLLLVLAPVATAQEDPGAAQALLRRVAEEQFATAADARPVDGIRLRLNLRERGEDPREMGFELHYSTRDRETIHVVVDDPDRGVRVAKGFDGRQYWLREADGERIDLGGHEYEKDRRSIDEALDLCADLMLLVDFRQLLQRADGLRLEEGDAVRSIHGRLQGAARDWDFRLDLPPDGLRPQSLVLRDPAQEEDGAGASRDADGSPTKDAEAPPYQRFELDHYARFQRRAVPQVIAVYASPAEDALPRRILEIRDFVWELAPRPGETAPGGTDEGGGDQRR